jgi:putative zinc finger/helix-turn-helix YgiT family protein
MKNARCPACGHNKLRREVGDFASQFEDSAGKVREVVVNGITKDICESCGEFVLSEGDEDKISAAQRAAMGLLSAHDLEAFRKRLGKSQEEMSELLGLGKRTWCRWESNDHFQSESFDRYLRLLMFVPANIQALELISVRKDALDSQSTLAERFPYIKDVRNAQVSGEQFTNMLNVGAFKT